MTTEQTREIMAAVMAMMVQATFETHIYEVEGETYQQLDGCPAGLRPSGPISRIVMDFWVEQIRQLEAQTAELKRINPIKFESLEINLLTKYVDDMFIAEQALKPGVRWEGTTKTLIWDQEAEKLDMKSSEPQDKQTMKLIAEIGL